MPLSLEEKQKKMEKLREELLAFEESPLYEYRTENNYMSVVGEGSLNAHILFIGEAPGKNEAVSGKPFCGRSGKMLDLLLASIGLDREKVYVTNIVKDRPPENRDPTPGEIELYAPFLDRQIEIIQPCVIATLGRFSSIYIIDRLHGDSPSRVISELHGTECTGQASYGRVVIVPLYHPAVALYNGKNKQTLLDDFQILKKYI